MRRLGDYIRPVEARNRDLAIHLSQGICNNKYFVNPKQVAENPETHKVVRTGQFAYNKATTRNGDKISIALRQGPDCTVSSAYQIFEIIDEDVLNPEYLMMWFRRPIFDRYARFKSHGSAHEFFEWESMCEVQVPILPIEKQREIVAEYNTLQNRIETNKKLIATLEQTAQTLYRHTFVDNIDPNNLPSGWRMGTLGEIIDVNPKLSLKKDEECSFVEMDTLPIEGFGISEITKRDFSGGAKFQNGDVLFARITPCMENGKAGVIDGLNDGEVGAGSTEFIVLRGKTISLMGLLATIVRNEEFRTYAKAHQTGSDGRQRVEASCISAYEHPIPSEKQLVEIEKDFSQIVKVCLSKSEENQILTQMQTLLLSKMGV